MKNGLIILSFLPLLSCNNNAGNKSIENKSLEVATTLSTEKTDTLCFLHTAGLRHQDTTFVRLLLRNEQVTGNIQSIPFEKDARRGKINARKTGNDIKGVWFFEQEGMKDSLEIAFKLEENKLRQKPWTVDPATGREILRDTTSYSLVYDKGDCRLIY